MGDCCVAGGEAGAATAGDRANAVTAFDLYAVVTVVGEVGAIEELITVAAEIMSAYTHSWQCSL